MSILIAYYDSLQKIESNEYNIIDMQELSIFSSLFLDIGHMAMVS
jgi:hypothetical protein